MTTEEIIKLIIAGVIGFIAIKISLNFDLNKFLENRRQIKINQLKNICPHCKVTLNETTKAFTMESFFHTPVGTVNYYCSQCGLEVSSQHEIERIYEPIQQNPVLYIEKQKKFVKQAKKLKLL